MKTDNQLKAALVKMLPDEINFQTWPDGEERLCWARTSKRHDRPVEDTELLHLCRLVEQTLGFDEGRGYAVLLVQAQGIDANIPKTESGVFLIINASWQQKVTALANVKGITI